MLGTDFAHAFQTFFPCISKFCVRQAMVSWVTRADNLLVCTGRNVRPAAVRCF